MHLVTVVDGHSKTCPAQAFVYICCANKYSSVLQDIKAVLQWVMQADAYPVSTLAYPSIP